MEQVGNFSKLQRAREQAFYANAALRLDVQGARLAAEQTAANLGLTRTTRFVNVLELGLARNSSNEAPTQPVRSGRPRDGGRKRRRASLNFEGTHMVSRRNFRGRAGSAGAAVTAAVSAASVSKVAMAALPEPVIQTQPDTMPPLVPNTGRPYNPVVTLNSWTCPWRMNQGVKEFHLVAEPVVRDMAPGFKAHLWGYNGQSPGPTIEVVEGDRVRIFVTNKLGELTGIHWHGQRLPNGMDGVTGLNPPGIPPDNTAAIMVGQGPFGAVGMGGMVSVVKARKDQKRGEDSDPGWCRHPPGTVAYEFTGSLPDPARFKADASPGPAPCPRVPRRRRRWRSRCASLRAATRATEQRASRRTACTAATGQDWQIVWTFNRAGEFEFACLSAGHFQGGMVGTIRVVPAARPQSRDPQT